MIRELRTGVVTLGLVLAACEMGGEDEPGSFERNAEVKPVSCPIDAWEPNPSAEQPAVMTWENIDSGGAESRGIEAYLCAGEEDWYYFETESLEFEEFNLLAWTTIEE